MKQAFFLVSALFVLFQLGEKVTAASVEASSGNEESDQQDQIQYTEDEINRIVDGLKDSVNNEFDSFQILFSKAHQTVTGLIKAATNVQYDSSEEKKKIVQDFETEFNNGNAQLQVLIDQYQEQAVQLLDRVGENAKESLKKVVSDVNAVQDSPKSSIA